MSTLMPYELVSLLVRPGVMGLCDGQEHAPAQRERPTGGGRWGARGAMSSCGGGERGGRWCDGAGDTLLPYERQTADRLQTRSAALRAGSVPPRTATGAGESVWSRQECRSYGRATAGVAVDRNGDGGLRRARVVGSRGRLDRRPFGALRVNSLLSYGFACLTADSSV